MQDHPHPTTAPRAAKLARTARSAVQVGKTVIKQTPAGRLVRAGAVGWAGYRMSVQAAANATGMETLRHGTGLQNLPGLVTRGGDPGEGGSWRGESGVYQGAAKMCENHFYAAPDHRLNGEDNTFAQRHLKTRAYAMQSGLAFGRRAVGNDSTPWSQDKFETAVWKMLAFTSAAGVGMLAPVQRFYYPNQDAVRDQFTKDPWTRYGIRTTEPVPASRMGIRGVARALVENGGPDLSLDDRKAEAVGEALGGAYLLRRAWWLAQNNQKPAVQGRFFKRAAIRAGRSMRGIARLGLFGFAWFVD